MVRDVLMIIFTFVIAGSTVWYAITTQQLLRVTNASVRVTQSSVEVAKESFEAAKRASYGNTLQAIAAAHRDLAFKALESRELKKVFMPAGPKDIQKLKSALGKGRKLTATERLFSTALINHAMTAFQHRRFETLPAALWKPIEKDIASLFCHPIVGKRWRETRAHYDDEFQRFVEEASKGC